VYVDPRYILAQRGYGCQVFVVQGIVAGEELRTTDNRPPIMDKQFRRIN
jgi:hypothetical protein